MQLRVIPWTEDKEKRMRNQREIVGLKVVRVWVLCPLPSGLWLTITTGISLALNSASGEGITGFARI
jgi:hypothetical protein